MVDGGKGEDRRLESLFDKLEEFGTSLDDQERAALTELVSGGAAGSRPRSSAVHWTTSGHPDVDASTSNAGLTTASGLSGLSGSTDQPT